MRRLLLITVSAVFISTTCLAQEEPITAPPPNIIVPNYNGIPSGPLGGLEGSAHIARAGDTSAPWFNPAGLPRAGTQLSGSVGNYQFTTVTPKRLPDTGGSTQHLPNLVGATARFKGFTVGFSMVTTAAWSSSLDSLYTLTNANGSPQRFAYSADSRLSQRVQAAGIGRALGEEWNVGIGVANTETSFRSDQIISDRLAMPDAIRTLLYASRAGGSITTLRAVIGVQYQPIPVMRLGLVTRTPGIEYGSGGSISVDSTLDGGGPSIGASVYDGSADFEYKLPVEVGGGIAFVSSRAEFEFDITHYSSVGSHALLSSSEPLSIYRDPGNGTGGTIEDRPFPSVMTAFRAVTNYAGGGHVLVLNNPLPLTLHAGIATDYSPVPGEDSAVFGLVDFTVYTAGISGSIGQFAFAFGINSRRGTINNLVFENLVTGPIRAELKVKTLGITYALNYKF